MSYANETTDATYSIKCSKLIFIVYSTSCYKTKLEPS